MVITAFMLSLQFVPSTERRRNEDVPKDEIVDRLCLLLKINKKEIKVADVGYSFTSGESKIVSETRKRRVSLDIRHLKILKNIFRNMQL